MRFNLKNLSLGGGICQGRDFFYFYPAKISEKWPDFKGREKASTDLKLAKFWQFVG